METYIYEGKKVFLALEDDMPNAKPIASAAGVGCYPVEIYNGEDSRVTDDQIYGGTDECDVEIVDTECVNAGNPQCLVEGWWTTDYAQWDLINRELCTATTRYYRWTSELTRFFDRLDDAYREAYHDGTLDEFDETPWIEEWKDTCDEYLDKWADDNAMELPEIPTVDDMINMINL